MRYGNICAINCHTQDTRLVCTLSHTRYKTGMSTVIHKIGMSTATHKIQDWYLHCHTQDTILVSPLSHTRYKTGTSTYTQYTRLVCPLSHWRYKTYELSRLKNHRTHTSYPQVLCARTWTLLAWQNNQPQKRNIVPGQEHQPCSRRTQIRTGWHYVPFSETAVTNW